MKKTANKDWFIIEKDGEFFAIEDKHSGIEPKMLKGEVVGICSFKEPVDAINYIRFILSGGR